MTRKLFVPLFLLSTLLLSATCAAPPEGPGQGPGKTPISVRGWIAYIQLPPQELMKVSDPEQARRHMRQFLQDTNIYVVDMPFVSGSIAETGAFIMLDIPPGDVRVRFQPPGLPEAELLLRNLPGNADVLLPALKIENDQITLMDPSKAVVRIPIEGGERRKLDSVVFAGSHEVEVWEVPFGDLVDRREFPTGEEKLPKELVIPKVK
jgi:hypothetical protein